MRELLLTALEAASAATSVHLRYAGGRTAVESAREKGTSDFVSQVDLEAQRAAVSAIRARFPHHRIMAEEEDPHGREEERRSDGGGTGSHPGAGPVWVVDPLDGTTNYLHRHPQYAASVGILEAGRAVAGAVMAGATGERWWALRGSGAYKDGHRIHTSAVRALPDALVGTGYPFKRLDLLPAYLEQFGRVLPATMGIRRGGSAALDLCALAQGTLDGFWELILSPWDITAGVAILEEAGGVACRVDGSPLRMEEPESVLAANSRRLLTSLKEVVGGDEKPSRPG